ncbi:hypothetical protein GCK72_020132 [Caenorhabditis remanei]|uniref:Uncharacterized protein n=1 Tax=Caenorhabditis remanei TaxID=31234 RepID=A0A6A5GFU5_CAERE|nr:hypothetical protein GCK72_020132 [Caenorhabditis remanei]KAF1753575.1 hypothetical protein GCK72_020132 [Caenorhabditis remanei]
MSPDSPNSSFDWISDSDDDQSFHSESIAAPEVSAPQPCAPVVRTEKPSDVEIAIFCAFVFVLSFAFASALMGSGSNGVKTNLTGLPPIDYDFNPIQFEMEFEKRKLEQFSDVVARDAEMRRAEKIVDSRSWTRLDEIPEVLLDKFTPHSHRFEGVQEFLEKTGLNGTAIEEAIYFHKLKLVWNKKNGCFNPKWHPLNAHVFARFMVGAEARFHESWRIELGYFHYHFQMDTEKETLGVKLVYYFPIEDLVNV